MSMFGKLKTDGLEESTDRLGGYQTLPSGAITGKIKMAYAGVSKNGAQSISLVVDNNGQEYRETLYITNKDGNNFYTKDGKKVPLPGFTTADDICLVTTGQPLANQETEDKIVKLYDSVEKKELPKSVPVLINLLGQDVTLGILNELVNKEESGDDGKYYPIPEERNQNVINKVFHTETKMTVAEGRQGAEKAAFYDSWVERNTGKVIDKRKIKDGAAVPGKPSVAGASPTADAPKKAGLFGKSS